MIAPNLTKLVKQAAACLSPMFETKAAKAELDALVAEHEALTAWGNHEHVDSSPAMVRKVYDAHAAVERTKETPHD